MSTLANAMKAFIQSGGDRTKMLIPLWAQTYHVGVEAVRQEWERQMSEASLQPTNKYDETGEGK